jgi:tRNA A37 threonylcarbamoyladenosine biosynthesis protein TsaE
MRISKAADTSPVGNDPSSEGDAASPAGDAVSLTGDLLASPKTLLNQGMARGLSLPTEDVSPIIHKSRYSQNPLRAPSL